MMFSIGKQELGVNNYITSSVGKLGARYQFRNCSSSFPAIDPPASMNSVATDKLDFLGAGTLPTLVTSQRVPRRRALSGCAASAAGGYNVENDTAAANVRKPISLTSPLSSSSSDVCSKNVRTTTTAA